MASLFLKSFHRYGKLTFEIELKKIYGLLPASLSHQSRTSIAALHSLLHVPCSAAEPQHGSDLCYTKVPQIVPASQVGSKCQSVTH